MQIFSGLYCVVHVFSIQDLLSCNVFLFTFLSFFRPICRRGRGRCCSPRMLPLPSTRTHTRTSMSGYDPLYCFDHYSVNYKHILFVPLSIYFNLCYFWTVVFLCRSEATNLPTYSDEGHLYQVNTAYPQKVSKWLAL